MGFDVGGNTAVLEFGPDTLLAGAEVRVSLDMSVRDFLALQRVVNAVAGKESGEQLENLEEAFRTFGDIALTSWNLVKRGIDLPATGEGMLQLPFRSASAIFAAWGSAVAGQVSPNLNAVSESGESAAAD